MAGLRDRLRQRQRRAERYAGKVVARADRAVLGSSHYTQAYALVRLHLIHASAGEMGAGKSGGFSIYSPLPVSNDASAAEYGPPRAETLLAILRRLRDQGYEVRRCLARPR